MSKKKRSAKSKILAKANRFSFTQLFIFAVLFAAVGGLVVWKSLAATVSSISLDQANPVYGQQITLTAVYPSEARKKIGTRQSNQPQINVICNQNGATVYYRVGGVAKETNLSGGWWQGESGLFTLGGNTSVGNNTYSWPSGPATCTGFSGYFTTDSTKALYWHSLASVDFQIN